MHRNAVAAWLGVALLTACVDATDIELIEVAGTGMLVGQAFLDVNGSGAVDAADRPLRGVSVLILAPGTLDTIAEATTDTLGLFALPNLPLGVFSLRLDSATVLADSLSTLVPTGTVTVE